MRKTALVASWAVMVIALAGCATGGGGTAKEAGAMKGVSDAEGIKQTLEAWKAGMETKDVTKLGSVISDKFSHYEWGDKTQMLSFLKEQFAQGTLDGAKIDASAAKTTIENGVATVFPVKMTAPVGDITIEFTLAKEADGVWRATKINVTGV